MICKTAGVVLRAMKFQESSLIVTLYTEQAGMKDFLVKGVRTSRGRMKQSFFQLLSQLEVVYYEKPGRDLQYISDSSFTYFYTTLTTQPAKTVYGLLVAEVFYKAVREAEPNPILFNTLVETLILLDSEAHGLFEISFRFLLQLTRPLGFFPHQAEIDESLPIVFYLNEGTLHNDPNAQGEATELGQLFYIAALSPTALTMPRTPQPLRRAALALLFRFYGLHLEGFRPPKSLEVFEQLFRS